GARRAAGRRAAAAVRGAGAAAHRRAGRGAAGAAPAPGAWDHVRRRGLRRGGVLRDRAGPARGERPDTDRRPARPRAEPHAPLRGAVGGRDGPAGAGGTGGRRGGRHLDDRLRPVAAPRPRHGYSPGSSTARAPPCAVPRNSPSRPTNPPRPDGSLETTGQSSGGRPVAWGPEAV